MRSLQHINNYCYLHGKEITNAEAIILLSDLQIDIEHGKISKKDPYHKEVDQIQKSLVSLVNILPNGEVAQIEIEAARLKHYLGILEAQGLGFLPLMMSAALTKFCEHHISKMVGHKPMSGVDEYTEKEAIELGIIDENLGFVHSPKVAFKQVNDRILKEIQQGNLIYRKPWKNGTAYNYETNKPYRGGNAFLIAMTNYLNATGYTRFLTAKQIGKRGGKLKKTAQAFPVEAYIKSEEKKITSEGKEEIYEKKGVIFYTVYPIEHTTGLKLKQNDTEPVMIIPGAQDLIDNMPKRPKILSGGNRAFYLPKRDSIQMPLKKMFNSMNEYYSTLFHELIHSTGNKKRIGRDMSGKKGNEKYALEELIAELGAAYLCAVCEIDYYTLNNSAAYLKSWSTMLAKEIKANPHFLMRAVYSASKAANYIIGNTLNKAVKTVKKAAKKAMPVKKTEPRGITTIKDPKPVKKAVSNQLKLTLNGVNSDILKTGGFVTADKTQAVKSPDVFRAPGEIGKFLQDIQRFKYAVAVTGDPHAGKTEFIFQVANAFASIGDDVGVFSLEQGGVESKDTKGAIDRNIKPENKKHIHITGEAAKGLETIKEFAKAFKVVIIDSWQKLKLPATHFDELRKEFPNVIWIVIFQQTTDGKAKGGSASEYDAPVVLKVHKVDFTRKNNWVELVKNRGNMLDVKYMLYSKKTVPLIDVKPEPKKKLEKEKI